MPYVANVSDEPEKNDYILGFSRGVNTLQDVTLVNDKNLIQGDNVMLVVDGVTRRYGTTKVYDEGGGSKVYGSIGFYKKSDGTRKWLRISNGKLQYLNGSNWTDIGATAYTNTKTSFVQIANKVFVHNGVDAMTYYDGSSITTYTALDTPTGLAVTPRFETLAAISSITRSSSTATVTTSTAHNLVTGDYVTISGAAQTEYNVTAQITVTSTTTFTYTVSGTPATPATGTIVMTNGGVTQNSYRIEAFGPTGGTAACARVSISNAYKTLDANNFNAVTWNAVTGATGYNVYGRTSSGYQEVYLATVYTTSYNDTGADTPVVTKLAPEVNTSGGIKAKHAIYALGRQFAIGVTEGSTYYPTRIYYSGTVNYIDSFTAWTYGGGWVEVYSNDGGEIVSIVPYQSGILVFKTNGIFYFYFTSSGDPALKDVTRAYGGTSIDCVQAIENNIVVVGQMENRIGVWTVGTQANYGSDEIRTNELSIFIKNSLEDVNRTYLSNITTFFHDNKFGFTYTSGTNTENSQGWIFDTQFGSWVHWDGDPMEATHYVQWDDGATVKLYACSNSDGYMIEMMREQRNDNGVAFRSIIGTKFYNQQLFDVEKIYRNPVLWFKFIQNGAISAEIWLDGANFAGQSLVQTNESGAGIGIDLMGVTLPGDSYSSITQTEAKADVIHELTFMDFARSMGIYLIDESYNSNWIFMGLDIPYTVLRGKPPDDLNRVTMSVT